MHEDLLRHIWAKQLFDAARLVTTDGRAVRITNAGTLHRGSGPDFRNAVIEIGGTKYAGDIEFHRTGNDWALHHHHADQKYNSVILHVVLSGSESIATSNSGRIIPTLILEPFLLSSPSSLLDQLSREEYSSKKKSIYCSDRNGTVSASLLQNWMRVLYKERLQEKIARLHDRLCDIIVKQRRTIREPRPPYNDTLDPNDIPLPDSGLDAELFRQKLPWEQLLFEQMMDGLGYANNRGAMKRIADEISLYHFMEFCHSSASKYPAVKELTSLHIEAILFTLSGLLPALAEVHDQDSKVHIHSLRAAWNEVSDRKIFPPVHRSEWIFSPTRPSNFPTIRMAAASVLLHRILFGSLFKSLITLIGGKYSSVQSKIEQMHLLLDPGDHSYWNYHYSFTEATHRKHAILGEARKNDIVVNVIIPFVCLYAKIFSKQDLMEYCLNIAAEMPVLEENTILRIMEKQLIKMKTKIEFAYQQQGLIQLNRRYCSEERCNECEVGKVILNK